MAASSAPLSLFPPITASQPPKSTSKQSKGVDAQGASLELKAVAIQIAANQTASPVIQLGNEYFRHSLFCEPANKPSTDTQLIKRTAIVPKRPRGPGSEPSEDPVAGGSKSVSAHHDCEDDVLPELPENTNFAYKRSPRNHRTKRQLNPKMVDVSPQVANGVQTASQAMKDNDRISPLPDKTRFISPVLQDLEYPTSLSERSGSPTLVRKNSGASSCPPTSPPAMRSMFPLYDPSRALCDQPYYPASSSPAMSLPSGKVSKISSPQVASHSALSVSDTPRTLVDGYEHIRKADSSDLQELWNASCGHFPVAGRKVQLGLHQPPDRGMCLVIGTSAGTALYSMEKDFTDQLVIRKHCPQQSSFTPVAELVLPESPQLKKNCKREEFVSIFPQMAGVHALESASNSHSASKIASFDPSAHSPEAARLAHDAVSQAHAKHRCRLVRATRKRDSLGAVTASYSLEHPSHGSFAITVKKSVAGGRHARDPRARITLHHPSATAAAVAAETLALACVDFSRDACILDTPALLALEGSYVIDTVIASLLAVAVIENDALVAEAMSFDPPPKSPVASPKRKSGRRKSSASVRTVKSKGWLRRKSRKEAELQAEQVELPALTQGALALLGLSFKTAVFVLETGVKVTAGVVVGVSHLVSKA